MAGAKAAKQRRPAESFPIASVAVDVPLSHLDHPFDYMVPQQWDEQAVAGCRVRVRFRGKLVDGFLLERKETSEFTGTLMWLERVVSPEPVLSPDLLELARSVAERYAGTLCDVVDLVVPPRHAKAEKDAPEGGSAPLPNRPDTAAWERYQYGPAYLEALHTGKAPRAVWQALPGEEWPARLAEAAAVVAATGRGAVLVVPDHRDLARLHAACVALLGEHGVVALEAEVGPAARYRRWLAVHRGAVRVVVGTRAAMFAPVHNLGLAVVWDDGDDMHSYPRAPYPHVRDVLTHRAHAANAALLVGGFARTAEAALLVESGWAREVTGSRAEVRAAAPRVTAIGEDDSQQVRDPAARQARIPSVAFEAARSALRDGAPVLVQVPRRGYVPALACGDCREIARCRRCAGPLGLPGAGDDGSPRPAACRWCGVVESAFRCAHCGSRRLRAIAIGAGRTAEELRRAFHNVPVRTSHGGQSLETIPAEPSLVVCTPGAEPVVSGGYGAALLLDGHALLARPDLRAAENALRLWFTAAALVRPSGRGGRVVVMADSTLQPVQALVRWDPSWYAAIELAGRAELGFPPVKRVAAVDGSPDAVAELLDVLEVPDSGEILGPVPLGDGDDEPEQERALVRVSRSQGRALASALHAAQAVRAARKPTERVRVRLDPLEMV